MFGSLNKEQRLQNTLASFYCFSIKLKWSLCKPWRRMGE